MTSDGQTPDEVGLKSTWRADQLCVLDAAVKREGSQAAFAKRYGLDRGTMNSILNGKRRVSATLLKAFGLRKVYLIGDHKVLSGTPDGFVRLVAVGRVTAAGTVPVELPDRHKEHRG
jgi:hypothetical protein